MNRGVVEEEEEDEEKEDNENDATTNGDDGNGNDEEDEEDDGVGAGGGGNGGDDNKRAGTDDGGNKAGGMTDGDDNNNNKDGDDNNQQQQQQQQQRRRLLVKTKRKKSMREKYQVVNDPKTYLTLRLEQNEKALPILYTSDLEWVVNPNLDWTDRWDIYLMGSPDDDIHFFAILNSFMIVLFLTGAIAIIMIRTLKKDILAYNTMDDGGSNNNIEEAGWKLVHGDVFRPPSYRPMLLSVLVGTGHKLVRQFSVPWSLRY